MRPAVFGLFFVAHPRPLRPVIFLAIDRTFADLGFTPDAAFALGVIVGIIAGLLLGFAIDQLVVLRLVRWHALWRRRRGR